MGSTNRVSLGRRRAVVYGIASPSPILGAGDEVSIRLFVSALGVIDFFRRRGASTVVGRTMGDLASGGTIAGYRVALHGGFQTNAYLAAGGGRRFVRVVRFGGPVTARQGAHFAVDEAPIDDGRLLRGAHQVNALRIKEEIKGATWTRD